MFSYKEVIDSHYCELKSLDERINAFDLNDNLIHQLILNEEDFIVQKKIFFDILISILNALLFLQ